MKVRIETAYSAYNVDEFELPEGKTWADVKSFFVKWGTAHITFKCGLEFERDLGDGLEVDWKRSSDTEVFEVAEDGSYDYDKPLI